MSSSLAGLLGPHGRFAASGEGFEFRPSQLAMADAIARALDDRRPLLVEAGTGVGKTLAYLLAAAESGQRVVVSTGTRTLQRQLLERDVPLASRILGRDLDAALLKGIGNYVCRRKLATFPDGESPLLDRLLGWAQRSPTGDRADADFVPEEDPLWGRVTTTSDERLGPPCPYFSRCFVTLARKRAEGASIVIVNHHLLLSHLSLAARSPGAAVLPAWDALILDEAHQLEDIAADHFGLQLSAHRVRRVLSDAMHVLVERADAERFGSVSSARALLDKSGHATDTLLGAMRMHMGIRGSMGKSAEPGSGDSSSEPLIRTTRVPFPDDLMLGTRRDAWLALDMLLDALACESRRRAEIASEDLAPAAAGLARRTDELRRDLAELAEPTGQGWLRWVELDAQRIALKASPVDLGPSLRRSLLGSSGTVIYTSATLTVNGSFDYARRSFGLEADDADELSLPSPFDFPKQSLLYLPRDLPEPAHPEFLVHALARVRELLAITQGRAFVLFTSHRSLRQAAAGLADCPYPLLVQGEVPRESLIERFRSTQGAVLLGTSSFWEGVDVPGDALSLVIIEKLPFEPPDDPVGRARMQALADAGLDPFAEHQVPRAALVLKQGFGRLIRRTTDRGIVAILDSRVVTRGYGMTFLRSLPPARRTSALEQVRRFWVQDPAPAPCAPTTSTPYIPVVAALRDSPALPRDASVSALSGAADGPTTNPFGVDP